MLYSLKILKSDSVAKMSYFSINVFRGSYYTPFFYIALFFFPSVTLDLKALYMLIVKLGDETFVLGGRGIDIEVLFFVPCFTGIYINI